MKGALPTFFGGECSGAGPGDVFPFPHLEGAHEGPIVWIPAHGSLAAPKDSAEEARGLFAHWSPTYCYGHRDAVA